MKVFAEIEVVFDDKKDAFDKIPSSWFVPPLWIFITGPSISTPGFMHHWIEIPS
jgi:hypothetical protein